MLLCPLSGVCVSNQPEPTGCWAGRRFLLEAPSSLGQRLI